MIAAFQDLAREPNQEASGKTAAYLDACNLLFEQGLLSRRRINNSSGQYKEGKALLMMIQVIAGACVSTRAKLYNKLSFPLLHEFVVGTIQ